MKLATSLLITALALAPAVAFAKDKTTQTTPATTMTKTTTYGKTTSTGSVQSNKIDINTASESDLTALFSKYEKPAKAEKSAEAVIGGRNDGKDGKYSSTKDLLTKKIVSAKLYNSVKSKLSAQ